MCLSAWEELEAASLSLLSWTLSCSSGRPIRPSAVMRLATWGATETLPGLFCDEAMVTSLLNSEVMLLNVAWRLGSTLHGSPGILRSTSGWAGPEWKFQAAGAQGPGLWPCGQSLLAPHSLDPTLPGQGLLSWAHACSHSLGHDFRFNW